LERERPQWKRRRNYGGNETVQRRKNEFHETLQTELDNVVGNKILMGDINGRISSDIY
jgi:hypothetical protein